MRIRGGVVALVVAMLVAGCGGSSDGGRPAASSSAGGKLGGARRVFAPAPLTDVFTGPGDRREKSNPGLDVRFNFAGSSALATQLSQGAPADVFASADEAQMTVVTDAGLQGQEP